MTREEEIQVESHRALNKELVPDNNHIAFEKGFCIGAKYVDQHPRKGLWDAEKVCKFLYEKVVDITYLNEDNTNEHYDKDEFIEDLRKAMEEE